jgi:Protein of unknown function (DUF2949)
MTQKPEPQLIEFLQQELSISMEAIGWVLRHPETPLQQLPIQLWQYGLMTLQQLEQVFDWQEQIALKGVRM